MDALLVIDIDGGDHWDSSVAQLDPEKKKVACAIQKTINEWRAANALVIYIVYVRGFACSPSAQITWNRKQPGCIACDLSEDARLTPFLKHRHGSQYEPVFVKYTNDAFTNPELIEYLRACGVTRVFLAGCNTFFCVLDTAKGAVRNGFRVPLLEECSYPALGNDQYRQDWVVDVRRIATPDCIDSAVSILSFGPARLAEVA